MNIKTTLVLICTCLTACYTMGQKNLLPNGSFDEIKGKVKKPGQIELAKGWHSPTDPKADLFSEKSKGDFSVPDNIHGRETPDEGGNYAGILAYSYKNRSPVTYLSTELEYPLEEEEVYCIKMLVSLSDLSKYACNNIGLYISNQKPTGKQILSYVIDPQIMAANNRILDEQYAFEAICKMYKAEGGEKFILIGNFSKPENTKWKKMKRPKGFSTPQTNDAYYYIESVSVIPMDSLEECECDRNNGPRMKIVYSENISSKANDKIEKQIDNTNVYFEFKKKEILANSRFQLDTLIEELKRHPSVKLEIQGFTEPQEQIKLEEDEDLSRERAKVVYDYMISKGIDQGRLIYKGYQDSEQVDEADTPQGRARNRRVEFRLVK